MGALVTAHRYGRELRRDWGALSRGRYFYGDSEPAQRQWMRDLRAKRELIKQHGADRGAQLWAAMVARHREQFGRQPSANPTEGR